LVVRQSRGTQLWNRRGQQSLGLHSAATRMQRLNARQYGRCRLARELLINDRPQQHLERALHLRGLAAEGAGLLDDRRQFATRAAQRADGLLWVVGECHSKSLGLKRMSVRVSRAVRDGTNRQLYRDA